MTLQEFVAESNRIEGIASVGLGEVEAHNRFLRLDSLSISDLEAFVSVVQPGARLRDQVGFDVRVGSHRPPRGGPEIREDLDRLLGSIENLTPYESHCRYERLHPFTDGNGRSGRVLWLWLMDADTRLGFLHMFYYQTLAASRMV